MLVKNVYSTFDTFSTSWDEKNKLIKKKNGISNRMDVVLKDYLCNESIILDIGCGTGKVYEIIKNKHKKKCTIDMIDMSEKMCTLARNKFLEDSTVIVIYIDRYKKRFRYKANHIH